MKSHPLSPRGCDRGLLLLLLGTLFCAATASHAADWNQWRGPNRDGISSEGGWLPVWPKEGPKRLWTAKVGAGWSSVAAVSGRVYTLGNVNETDQVLCLDSNTGGALWRHAYACASADPNGYPGPRCTPTVDDKLLFTLSRRGQLYCLNTDNGRIVWWWDLAQKFGARFPTWGLSGSPLVEGNMVIVETGAAGGSVIAFEKLSGRVLWRSGNDAAGYSSPVAFDFNNQRQIAVFSAAGISGRAANDGRILWSFPWQTQYGVNAATPVVFGDKVFISSGYNRGCALVEFGSKQPKAVWSNGNMRNHCTSCVLWQGNLYGFDEGQLRCLDFVTGAVRWSQGSFGKGSLIVVDGKLLIYGEGGRLAVAEAMPEGYKELASAQVIGGRSTWAPPVLSGGKIYCRSADNLICLDVRGK